MKKCAFTYARVFLVILASTVMLVACDDDESTGTGTVNFSWTVAGATDPLVCQRYGIESFLAVFVDQGFAVREFEIPCKDFSASVRVLADDYIVRMTLVDVQSFAVSDRVVSATLTLRDKQTKTIAADFPADSLEGLTDGGVTDGGGGVTEGDGGNADGGG